jgi:dihydroneopterin aldolase
VQQGVFAEDPFHTLDVDGVGELLLIAAERGRASPARLTLSICGEHGGNAESCSPFRVPVARLAAAQSPSAGAPGIRLCLVLALPCAGAARLAAAHVLAMSTDIRLAFAHPEERATASAPASPRDRISLRDHVVEAEIGAFQAERGTTQRLRFNVVVEVRPHPEPLQTMWTASCPMTASPRRSRHELAAERLNLLETLAERVAERILAAPQAMRVFVRIEKLDRGPGALGVEIARSRAPVRRPGRRPTTAAMRLHPLVVYL